MNNCPICGQASLRRNERDEAFAYEGHVATIQGYTTWDCAACGESVVDPASLKKSEAVLRDLQREAEGLLTSAEIKRIREGLGFSQDALGELLGGGLKAFARYEGGRVSQSRPMDNLLRVLWAYPEAIQVLRGNAGRPQAEKAQS
jgi:HTH-type transcriptional regulator / antitoxin MqsA